MPNLSDLISIAKETRELTKGIAKKTGVFESYVFGVGAAGAIAKFSLPDRVSYCVFVASDSPIYFSFSSAATIAFIRLLTGARLGGSPIDSSFRPAKRGPFDLSNSHIFVDSNSSGATITAWVLTSPSPA